MSNKIATNYLLNLCYNVLIIIVPLITTPYISRTVGAEGIGIYTYCLSFSTYFIVAGTIGIPLYGKRSIAFVKKDQAKLDTLFSELITLQIILLGLSLTLYVIFFLIYQKYIYMFMACGLGVIAALFDTSWLYVGLEEFRKIVFRGFIIKIISVISIFAFVKSRRDLYIYALSIMVANLIGNIWMFVDVGKYVHYDRPKLISCVKHFKPALILLLPNIINTIYSVIDRTLLGVLSSDISEVGYYEQSQKIITLSLTLVTSLGTILMPRLASLFSENKTSEIEAYVNKGIRIISFIALPLSFGLFAISDSLVPWFFGDGYEKVNVLIRIFSPVIFLLGVSDLIGTQYLIAIKKEKTLLFINCATCIVNILLDIILIPFMQSYGAAIATLISEIIKIIACFSATKIHIFNNINYCCKYGMISFFMLIAIEFIYKNYLNASTILNTIVLVIGGIFIYFSIMIITKDTIIQMVVNVFQSKLRNNSCKIRGKRGNE